MLDALRFRRYRAFDDWTELELRPLTVVFGYNNSGKSAAVRLLPGIAESVVARGAAPLALGGEVFGGARFSEVSHRGGQEVEFELEWSEPDPDSIERARWTLRAETAAERHWVDALTVDRRRGTDQVTPVELRWLEAGERFEVYARVREGGEEPVGEVEFEGLVPRRMDDAPAALSDDMRTLAQQMTRLAERMRWVGGHRGTVGRSRPQPSAQPRTVRFDAGDAADTLFAYHARHGKALLTKVNEFYGDIGRPEPMVDSPVEPEPVHQLAVSSSHDGRYSLRLSRVGAASPYASNLADAGEGMTQVLPLAVALAQLSLDTPEAPRVLCIEQPELHLHPRAQQAIADRLVEAATTCRAARLLVETHAHHVMLSIQVALAEGRLSPDDVLVYWARQLPNGGSRLERVELDHLGRDTAGIWPPDVFGDDARMARRLIRARRQAASTAR